MKRNILIGVVVSCFMLFASQNTSACTCPTVGGKPTRLQYQNYITSRYNRAAVVFSGEILSLGKFFVVFKVNKIWKGKMTDKIELSIGTGIVKGDLPVVMYSSSSCDYNFMGKETKFLVFARRTKYGDLQTFACSLTRRMSKAKQIREVLKRMENFNDIKIVNHK